jgi:Zn-dependent peptidase ImmA (M78 family)
LLVPEAEVRPTWRGVISDCAAQFGVSDEAMHWRLYNFGLVDERPREGAYVSPRRS